MNVLNKKYKKNIVYLLIVIAILITACGKKEENIPKPFEGKYIATDGSGYITVENYRNGSSEEFEEVVGLCDLQFFNVDLSGYEEFYLLNNATNYIAVNTEGGLTDEEVEEIMDMLRANVNFKKQFEENKATFSYYEDDDGGHGLICEVEGSGFGQGYETYVNIQYIPNEKAICIDELKFELEG